jgi:hypothetical protein
MKNKKILLMLSILFIVAITLHINNNVKGQEPGVNIEVLIEGQDEMPQTGRIGDSIELKEDIEMWHFSGSGGYWKYEDIIIRDRELNRSVSNEAALEKALDKEISFEYKLNSELYSKLTKNENIKVVCSTKLENPVTGEYRPVTDIFHEVPDIQLKNNKIYFKGKPKLNFYTKDRITYSDYNRRHTQCTNPTG